MYPLNFSPPASAATDARTSGVRSGGNRSPVHLCSVELTRLVTAQSDLTCAEVSGTLAKLPPNMTSMLDHPEGWIALAGFVLTAFGVEARAPIVTVH